MRRSKLDNIEALVYNLLAQYASSDEDDEQYRQGYWDAIVDLAQLATGAGGDRVAAWVHAIYGQVCEDQ